MKRYFLPFLVLFFSMMNLSCQEQVPEVDKSFSIYAENGSLLHELVLGRTEQSKKLNMLASGSWQVSEHPDWLAVTPSEGGKSSRFLTLTASSNEEESDRTGKVEFTMGTEPVYSIQVLQYGKENDDTPDFDEGKKGKKADLLDVSFSSSGEARDLSAMNMEIQYLPSLAHLNYFNADFGWNVAHFNHDGNNITEGYYRVDYQKNSQFMSRLKDGHSMEMVFSCTNTPTGRSELKMFSSHEGGGTGFLISTTSHGNCITFLPNVSTSGRSNWIWTESGVTPQAGKYYHVIGVWDKSKSRSSIYINGKLCSEVDATGELVMPNAPEALWFGIGTDSNPAGGQSSLGGEIAVARIYDDPLSAEEVALLYQDVQKGIEAERIKIGDLEYLSDCQMPTGYWYHVFGTGFQEGDQLRFSSRKDKKVYFDCEGRVGKNEIAVQIPASLNSDIYNLLLVRGEQQIPIGPVQMKIGKLSEETIRTQCVAHRCYHQNGTDWPENSLAALKRTQELGCWGCEIDVWITRDDVVMVNHNKTYPTDKNNRQIQNSNYADLKDIRLSNGEVAPTLESFLKQMEAEPKLNLVLEIKSHSTRTDQNRVVDKCIEMVKAHELLDRVVWIAFDYASCQRVAAALPKAMVMYLGGNLEPSVCKADGVMGLDYQGGRMTDAWIAEAHKLGMKVNVWTINDQASMSRFIARGVDYITTDHPDVLQKMLSHQFVTEK